MSEWNPIRVGVQRVADAMRPEAVDDDRCECDDTGWLLRLCTHACRCGRRWCAHAEPAFEHTYVDYCTCALGDARRPKPPSVTVGGDEDLTSVGRTHGRRKKNSWRG